MSGSVFGRRQQPIDDHGCLPALWVAYQAFLDADVKGDLMPALIAQWRADHVPQHPRKGADRQGGNAKSTSGFNPLTIRAMLLPDPPAAWASGRPDVPSGWGALRRRSAAHGAHPYFTLFRGAGATATVVGSNYTQAFSTGGDFSFSAVLAAGAYRMRWARLHMSFAENLGSGVLGDGFVGLGVPAVLGDSRYRLEVNAPVPEPAGAGQGSPRLPFVEVGAA